MRRHEAVARKKSIPRPLKASVAVELKVRIGVMRRFPVLEGDFFRPERFRRGRKANNFWAPVLFPLRASEWPQQHFFGGRKESDFGNENKGRGQTFYMAVFARLYTFSRAGRGEWIPLLLPAL